MSNLYAAIRTTLSERPDAVVLETERATWTGTQLEQWVGRHAAALLALGLQPGDRIAVQIEKSPDNIALYLAALRIGAIYVPLNTAYQAREIEYFLGDAQPRVFVTTPERSSALEPVAVAANVQHVMTLGTASDGSLPELVGTQTREAPDRSPSAAMGRSPSAAMGRSPSAASAGAKEWPSAGAKERPSAAQERPPVVPRAVNDLAVICYTSGTTGRSKGAMISHGNMLSNARTLVSEWGFTASDVLLHALPLYHVHGLFIALHCALLSGARIVLHAKFEPRAALTDLARSTVMMGVPTFYTRLLGDPALTTAAVRNVRLFISGSAPLLAETFDAFERRTGHRILERYGMTETGMITSNPLHGERRGGTVGKPLPDVDVRITNDAGDAVPTGSIGNVEVKGPNVFQGYWRMPEKTALEFRSDGYFVTGDLGQLEPDGYLQLVGRAKDLIISGGLNVYPKEIEEAIDALPGVDESAVFAIPHPDFGEAVAAAVTLKTGASLDAETIVTALREQLAAFKTPKRVFIVASLPRNAMSKVQKNILRQTYKDEFSG